MKHSYARINFISLGTIDTNHLKKKDGVISNACLSLNLLILYFKQSTYTRKYCLHYLRVDTPQTVKEKEKNDVKYVR